MNQFTSTCARRAAPLALAAVAIGFCLAFSAGAQNEDSGNGEGSKIRIGFALAPVPLSMDGKNPDLVGLGSYLLNAHISCSECHTSPNFVAGGNPFLGQPERINTAGYLAGGRVFPTGVVSRNLTPDANGLPAGMTFEEFEYVMRTGEDVRHLPPHIPSPDLDLLQNMPWPTLRNMSDRDLQAIYEYLSAIPSVP